MTNVNITNGGYMIGLGSRVIDKDISNHFNRLTGTDSNLKNALSQLILGLKKDNLWAKIEQLCVCHDVDADSLLNLTGGTDAVKVGSPTFTANRGYTTVNATAYLDTGFNEGSTSLWAQHDAHFFAYNRTVDSTGQLTRINSGPQDSQLDYTNAPSPDEVTYLIQGGVFAVDIVISQDTPIGFNSMSIIANDDRLARLNDTTGSNATVETYTVGTDDIQVGALGAQQIAAWGFGSGLTSAELGLYEDNIRSFMQARGADVY